MNYTNYVVNGDVFRLCVGSGGPNVKTPATYNSQPDGSTPLGAYSYALFGSGKVVSKTLGEIYLKQGDVIDYRASRGELHHVVYGPEGGGYVAVQYQDPNRDFTFQVFKTTSTIQIPASQKDQHLVFLQGTGLINGVEYSLSNFPIVPPGSSVEVASKNGEFLVVMVLEEITS